jgi:glycosyltransferase involved in cell wall biosynthesis
MIDRDSVFGYFGQADLFVSASLGEGLPVAVLEAMACRCPVVLSDIPPHREIAKGVDFVPLIEPDDVAGFAREIERIREMPVSERIAIGQKCRQLVEERFSLSAMHAGLEKVYAQIINDRDLSPGETR